MTLAPLDVTSYTGLEITVALNAVANNVYDSMSLSNGDYLQVLTSIDGGGDTLIGQFTKMTSSGSNGRLGHDTDLDGLADVEIRDYNQFEDYTFSVPDEGSSITIKIVARFEAGGEEIVFDNLCVSGVPLAAVDDWMMILW